MDLFTYHKFHTNVSENPKEALTVGQKLLLGP